MQMRLLGCAAGAVLSLAACNTVTHGIEESHYHGQPGLCSDPNLTGA
jgi:hypothetical protein